MPNGSYDHIRTELLNKISDDGLNSLTADEKILLLATEMHLHTQDAGLRQTELLETLKVISWTAKTAVAVGGIVSALLGLVNWQTVSNLVGALARTIGE